MNGKINKIYENVREIIIVLLLFIWMLIPTLKSLKITIAQAMEYEYIFMMIVGGIGLAFFIIDLFIKWKESENKKEYCKKNLPIFILFIFMIWTYISCCFSPDPNKAFFGTTYRKEGYITYLIYAAFFGCAFLLKSKLSKNIVINSFAIIATLNIIILELYSRGIFKEFIATMRPNAGSFYQFNHYGYYLLLATVSSIFLCITQKNKIIKIIYLVLATLQMYSLILNNTFGCFLALAMTMLLFTIYCIYNKKIKLYVIILIIISLSMIFIIPEVRNITKNNIDKLVEDIKNIIAAEQADETDVKNKEKLEQLAERAGTNRMALWKNGIKFFLERPILGYGPENLGIKYAKVGILGGQDRPHNLLIQLATTSGIVGLITYVTAIGIIWIKGLRTIKFDNSIHTTAFFAVTAYLISAMFGNSMYYTSPYFFIFLGLLMHENINVVEDKEK